MRWIYKIPLRLRSLFRKSRVEQGLSDEMQFHLEKLTEENVASGMMPSAITSQPSLKPGTER
jgi:hypothetical protein